MNNLTKFDVCVYGVVFANIEAENENEAIQMALDEYFEITGLKAYADDEAVVWKPSAEYPYEWRGAGTESTKILVRDRATRDGIVLGVITAKTTTTQQIQDILNDKSLHISCTYDIKEHLPEDCVWQDPPEGEFEVWL